MCGIAAVFSGRGIGPDDAELLKKMLRSQRFRGPDHTGMVLTEKCAIGNNRLSVVDLNERSNQPLETPGGTYISFNGEIYNYREIRRKLESAGCRFRTQSDTETLLYSYEVFGPSFVEMLEGQFAFCLYDKGSGRIILARDRLGVVPLYYFVSKDRMYVSSDFRSLVKNVREHPGEVDPEGLSQYLHLRFCIPPDTIMRGIKQVEPSQMITFDGVRMTAGYYWNLPCERTSLPMKDASPRLHDLINKAVGEATMSDVPLCVFLSGGLDSSIVTRLASSKMPERISTFSIQFGGDEMEEVFYAKKVAEACGTDHHVCLAEPLDAVKDFFDMVASIDHPVAARDLFAPFVLARFIRERRPSVKVALFGTGADEMFNGYQNSYFMPIEDAGADQSCQYYVDRYGFASRECMEKFNGVLQFKPDREAVYSAALKAVRRMCPDSYGSYRHDACNRLNVFYMALHLSGWELAVNDSMCMSHSLEPRVPFLSRSVVEYSMSLPGIFKFRKDTDKYLLRRAFRNELLADVITRKKLPLSRPVARWLGVHCLPHIKNSVVFRDRGIFSQRVIEKLDNAAHFDIIWRAILLECWLQKNLDRN